MLRRVSMIQYDAIRRINTNAAAAAFEAEAGVELEVIRGLDLELELGAGAGSFTEDGGCPGGRRRPQWLRPQRFPTNGSAPLYFNRREGI